LALTKVAHYHDHGYALTDKWVRCRESQCFDPKPTYDRWLCTVRTKVRNEPRYTVCGQEYWYQRSKPGVVAGPGYRFLDRRYGVGPSYRCKGHSGGIHRHESAPDPEQPIQDPKLIEQIEHLKVVAKEARKKRGRRKKDAATPGEGIRPT
jgi:hypothetical protein